MSQRLLSFGPFLLNVDRRVLTRDGATLNVAHRGMALLERLLSANGHVVGKDELMEAAWPQQVVEESNLTVQISALRKLLGRRPDGEEWIVTIPRVGYQLLAAPDASAMPATAPTLPEAELRQSIAVLPFANLSADREQQHFADGMADDIIAALSRIGALFVISRSSSFSLKGQQLPASEAASRLGVRYVLEGSVRTAGHRVRVTAQLTDAQTGASVWAERYEGTSDDIFAVQDDITRNIVQALQVTLSIGESARLWEGQSRNLRAWEKAVLGHSIFQRYSTADTELGRSLLEEAVAIDPTFTGAMAFLGITHYWDARYSISVDRTEALRKAELYAARIAEIDPDLGQLFTLRSAISFVKHAHAEAVSWGTEAVKRSPSDSRAHGFLGMFLVYDGQLQSALSAIKLGIRHCPFPESYLPYYQAIIYMWLGQLDRALDLALNNRKLEPAEPYAAAYLAAVHGLRGDSRAAAQAVAALREATPSFGIRNIRHSELYRDPARLARIVEVLAAAGLEE